MSADLSFSSPQSDAAALSSSSMVSDNHVARKQTKPIHPVSADSGGCVGPFSHECPSECRADGTKVPPQAEVEAELDHAIKAAQARLQGDPHGASLYIRRMVKALRLQIAAAQRLDEGVDYFQAQGLAASRRAT